MLFILDSNEYIFGFGLFKKPSSEAIVETLLATFPNNRVRICRTIFEEVNRHLTAEEFKEFILFLVKLTFIDEDIMIPFEIGIKYESLGLKPADAFIAAYAEWTGADVLVTENRHFLSRQSNLPFRILNAERCLKLIKPSLSK